MKQSTTHHVWWCLGIGLTTLLLGLSLVWVNIELVDLSYSIKKMQATLQEEKNLKAKLELECVNLMSSYRLREKAEEFGLQPPKASQIRKMN
jgi:cell division protein FtsL